MKNNNSKTNRSGSVLVLSVIMVMVLALVGIGLIRLGRNARVQAVKEVLNISARSAADAGIEHAVRYMINSWNSTGNRYTWLEDWEDLTEWTDPAIPATPIGYPFGRISLDGTYGDASFTYNIYKGTFEKGYQIVSTGTAAGVTRTVHAAAVLRSVFEFMGTEESIYISPGEILGVIPADDDIEFRTNGIDPGAITLKPNLIIPGDVICGPGGDPDIAIDFAPNVEIVPPGQAKASEEYIDFPPEYAPDDLKNLPYSNPTIDVNDPKIAHIYGNIKLDELQFGLGLLKDVETLYIQGNPAINDGRVDVFVDGFTYLPAGTEIIVTEGSSLVLYLGGNMEVMPRSMITYEGMPENPDPVVYEDLIIEAASSISIIGLTDRDTEIPLCTDVYFKPDGDFYGSMYTPGADVYMAPNGDFYGIVTGAMTITLKPVGSFIFIPSLADFQNIPLYDMGIKDGSWWE